MTKIPVVEIFGPTCQGEGCLAGLRTMFIRLGGCDGVSGARDWCLWCDSMHAVDPINKKSWRWMNIHEIKEEVYTMAPWCQQVTISGGNPALHNLDELVRVLHYFGYTINVETQATFFRPWLAECSTITLSPKPPSSGPGSDPAIFEDFLKELLPQVRARNLDPVICIKVVIESENIEDIKFARKVFLVAENSDYDWMPLYLSVKTDPQDTTESLLTKYRGLVETVAMDKQMPDVHILAQLHVLLWGHRLGV